MQFEATSTLELDDEKHQRCRRREWLGNARSNQIGGLGTQRTNQHRTEVSAPNPEANGASVPIR